MRAQWQILENLPKIGPSFGILSVCKTERSLAFFDYPKTLKCRDL
ncbi:MAG: hypothetical protein ACRC2T_14890 [Thermoguttaceae bacterium]